MKGCRAIQCLVKKMSGCKPEDDDQGFEIRSDFFLAGTGDGSSSETPLPLYPMRHVTDSVYYEDILFSVSLALKSSNSTL